MADENQKIIKKIGVKKSKDNDFNYGEIAVDAQHIYLTVGQNDQPGETKTEQTLDTILNNTNMINSIGLAHKSHASSDKKFGPGTTGAYGHVRVTSDYDTSSTDQSIVLNQKGANDLYNFFLGKTNFITEAEYEQKTQDANTTEGYTDDPSKVYYVQRENGDGSIVTWDAENRTYIVYGEGDVGSVLTMEEYKTLVENETLPDVPGGSDELTGSSYAPAGMFYIKDGDLDCTFAKTITQADYSQLEAANAIDSNVTYYIDDDDDTFVASSIKYNRNENIQTVEQALDALFALLDK